MRTLALLLLTFPALVLAQAATQPAGTCASPFQAAVAPNHEISMTLRSGDIEIVGIAGTTLRVSCELNRSERAGEIKVGFAGDHLTIYGGPDNGVYFRIEVPKDTGLFVRGRAGNLTLSGVAGDKDVEVGAGNLTIEVGNAAAYRRAEASVLAGNLTASAFGVIKDGLLRNFQKDNPGGRYKLRAKLQAGNLTLK